MCGVNIMQRIGSEEISWCGCDVMKEYTIQRVESLRWFGHLERLDGNMLTNKVYEFWCRGHFRNRWRYGVMVALRGRGLSM